MDKLAVLYPGQMSNSKLKIIAISWVDDLVELSDAQFSAALRRHRRESRFFPTAADVLTAHRRNIEDVRPSAPVPQLPAGKDFLRDEFKRNADRAQAIIRDLAAKKSANGNIGNRGTSPHKRP